MANVNKVILIGNLTRDPEVKTTPKGTSVAQISLAINRKYKVGEEMKEETTFVDIELWGRLAEIAGQYAKKGNPLYIEGRLKQDSWDDKETGKKRTKMLVVGESLQLLGGRQGGGEGGGQRSEQSQRPAAQPSRAASPKPAGGGDQFPDDDIPF